MTARAIALPIRCSTVKKIDALFDKILDVEALLLWAWNSNAGVIEMNFTAVRHNLGKYCENNCGNYHVVAGDSACNVTGARLTSTHLQVILEVGCASYYPENKGANDSPTDDNLQCERD